MSSPPVHWRNVSEDGCGSPTISGPERKYAWAGVPAISCMAFRSWGSRKSRNSRAARSSIGFEARDPPRMELSCTVPPRLGIMAVRGQSRGGGRCHADLCQFRGVLSFLSERACQPRHAAAAFPRAPAWPCCALQRWFPRAMSWWLAGGAGRGLRLCLGLPSGGQKIAPPPSSHPLYSFMGDWLMYWQILTGQIAF